MPRSSTGRLGSGPRWAFDVHVARNDQSRVWKGQRLGDMSRRREQLPQQFDRVTTQTIELIDVLWLDGNAIVAAFEIESSTSICSGLLRMGIAWGHIPLRGYEQALPVGARPGSTAGVHPASQG